MNSWIIGIGLFLLQHTTIYIEFYRYNAKKGEPMKAVNEKMEENLKLIRDTLDFKETKKIPVGIQTTTWPIGYAGVKLNDVLDDPVANMMAYTKVYDDVEVNISTFGMNEMPLRLFQALEITKYYLGGDEVAILHRQSGEEYFGPEFYDDIQADGLNALEKYKALIYKKNIPVLNGPMEEAYDLFKKALPAMQNFFAFAGMGTQKLIEKGIPIVMNTTDFAAAGVPYWMGPFSSVMDSYRGIKESMIDLRRRPEAVKVACDVIAEDHAIGGGYETDAEKIRKSYEGHIVCFGLNILNAECFLSPKQFGPYYLDYFKKQMGPYIEAGGHVQIFMEGSLLRTADQYLDLPKGSLFIQPDLDDAFEMYKIFGHHHTICAGATVEMMKDGDSQGCIDYAKRCIDTFAPGGGFIF